MFSEIPNSNIVDAKIRGALTNHPTKKDVDDVMKSKQDALSTSQTNAVNSGVTKELVGKLKTIEEGAQKNPDLSQYAKKTDIPVIPDMSKYALNEKLQEEEVRAIKAERAINLNIESLNEKKVEKVIGKGLSTNDYTDADRDKLASITDEEGFVKKSRYAETALDANNAAFANHSEHANNAELATASQSSMALFPYSDGGSFKNQRNAELIFSQIDEKRKLNDNTAAVDSTVFTEWKFSDGKSYSMSIEPNIPMSDPVTGETVEGYVYYFDANSYYPSAFFQVTAYTVDENPLELKFNISDNEALSIWPDGLSATREHIVITKSGEPYATPTGVKNIAIPKYEFIDAAIVDGKVTVAPYTNAQVTSDGTAFSVAVAESDGKTRDCVLRVECGDTAPTITWGANFHPHTDLETDFACVVGKRNVYWITEYAPDGFVVAGWQETAGGNAE
jgi:hypothetical protein